MTTEEVSAVCSASTNRPKWGAAALGFGTALAMICSLMLLGASTAAAKNPSLAKQTREQCNKCCEKMDLDEYYTEQCKLRCFRNPDFCNESEIQAQTQPKPKAQAKPKPKPKPAKKRRTVRRRPAPQFRWPNPLNMTPGKEWEAAAQILAANQFSRNHPNYERALRSIEQELVNFARQNPQGGNLPTRRLERILRQYR